MCPISSSWVKVVRSVVEFRALSLGNGSEMRISVASSDGAFSSTPIRLCGNSFVNELSVESRRVSAPFHFCKFSNAVSISGREFA